MKKIHQIIRLIRILGTPGQEIVGTYILDGDIYNTIEVIDEDCFRLNVWELDYEFQLTSDNLHDDQLDQIIEQLEFILLS